MFVIFCFSAVGFFYSHLLSYFFIIIGISLRKHIILFKLPGLKLDGVPVPADLFIPDGFPLLLILFDLCIKLIAVCFFC
jgi:hypothetical protein